jgi:hypothetical protein
LFDHPKSSSSPVLALLHKLVTVQEHTCISRLLHSSVSSVSQQLIMEYLSGEMITQMTLFHNHNHIDVQVHTLSLRGQYMIYKWKLWARQLVSHVLDIYQVINDRNYDELLHSNISDFTYGLRLRRLHQSLL